MKSFERSELARSAFGAEVVEHYAHFFTTEAEDYRRAVTDWERETVFRAGLAVGYADDVGDGDGQTDGEGEAAQFYAGESSFLNRAHYVPVQVASGGREFPDRVGDGLKSLDSPVQRYDVFIEEKAASGPERPLYLADNAVEVLDDAERESRHHAVECVVGKRQALAYRGNHDGVGATFSRTFL